VASEKKKVRLFCMILNCAYDKVHKTPLLRRLFKKWKDVTYITYEPR